MQDKIINLKEEKKYLEKVKIVLKRIIYDSNKNIDKKKNELNDLKKFMWDNLTDYTDDEYAIAMHDMDYNVELTNDRIFSINKLQKALSNPYFEN